MNYNPRFFQNVSGRAPVRSDSTPGSTAKPVNAAGTIAPSGPPTGPSRAQGRAPPTGPKSMQPQTNVDPTTVIVKRKDNNLLHQSIREYTTEKEHLRRVIKDLEEEIRRKDAVIRQKDAEKDSIIRRKDNLIYELEGVVSRYEAWRLERIAAENMGEEFSAWIFPAVADIKAGLELGSGQHRAAPNDNKHLEAVKAVSAGDLDVKMGSIETKIDKFQSTLTSLASESMAGKAEIGVLSEQLDKTQGIHEEHVKVLDDLQSVISTGHKRIDRLGGCLAASIIMSKFKADKCVASMEEIVSNGFANSNLEHKKVFEQLSTCISVDMQSMGDNVISKLSDAINVGELGAKHVATSSRESLESRIQSSTADIILKFNASAEAFALKTRNELATTQKNIESKIEASTSDLVTTLSNNMRSNELCVNSAIFAAEENITAKLDSSTSDIITNLSALSKTHSADSDVCGRDSVEESLQEIQSDQSQIQQKIDTKTIEFVQSLGDKSKVLGNLPRIIQPNGRCSVRAVSLLLSALLVLSFAGWRANRGTMSPSIPETSISLPLMEDLWNSTAFSNYYAPHIPLWHCATPELFVPTCSSDLFIAPGVFEPMTYRDYHQFMLDRITEERRLTKLNGTDFLNIFEDEEPGCFRRWLNTGIEWLYRPTLPPLPGLLSRPS